MPLVNHVGSKNSAELQLGLGVELAKGRMMPISPDRQANLRLGQVDFLADRQAISSDSSAETDPRKKRLPTVPHDPRLVSTQAGCTV